MKRFAEIVGTQNGQVGVVGFQFLIGMPVDDGKIVVVIFLADKTARILSERTHLIFERLGVSHQFGFIQHIVYVFHNFVANFHTHANVHRTGFMGNPMFRTNFFQPIGTAPAGSCNRCAKSSPIS